jgi:dipeptidyl aminopeptidase/acylaminoacyl peptidase
MTPCMIRQKFLQHVWLNGNGHGHMKGLMKASAIGRLGCLLLGLLLSQLPLALPGQAQTSVIPGGAMPDGVPAIPPALIQATQRYQESRGVAFVGWKAGAAGSAPEALVSTRLGAVAQLHRLAKPGQNLEPLTQGAEPVAFAAWAPMRSDVLVYAQDTGGNENFQLYRYEASGKPLRLTDGKSRHTGVVWSHDGLLIAYSSTQRTGQDTDIWVMNPRDPTSAKLVLERKGGGWSVADWSRDKTQLLVRETLSANESRLHIFNLTTGQLTRLTPDGRERVAYGKAKFLPSGDVLATSNRDSQFQRLVRINHRTGISQPFGPKPKGSGHKWDVEDFDLAPNGMRLVYETNEDGFSIIRTLDLKTGKPGVAPKLPLKGVVSGLEFASDNVHIGFSLNGARTPGDVYVLRYGTPAVTRWAAGDLGAGLKSADFLEPSVMRTKSFDGLEISALVYRPDPLRFPGARPALLDIHGGPEAQARPNFLGRKAYLVNALGITIIFPNVRGSSGYGKSFLALDNGFKREDSVRDIGALLDALAQDVRIDKSRIGVTGGSYGGYMTLAAMIFYGDRLRAGFEAVGISSFTTFLKNTSPYRVDLRRVEYGDERQPEMAAFLDRISPLNQADKIRIPLLVATGLNDPRVPATEADQIIAAVRGNGGEAWHVFFKDEGHGFRKKPNQDYLMWVSTLFWQRHLLDAAQSAVDKGDAQELKVRSG